METHAHTPTCPFGPQGLSIAVLRTHRAVRDCPSGQPVHKWKVFRLICAARDRIGVSDRSLAVLDALVSFHPGTVLVAGDADLVVFPSNRRLALRAHGIAPSTLRRHEFHAVVEAEVGDDGGGHVREGVDLRPPDPLVAE